MISTFSDHETLSQAAARQILMMGQRCLVERQRYDLVLAGGKTPNRTYEILAATGCANRNLWENTHIYWGDERCVAPDHAESNYHSARVHLLDTLEIAPDHVHRIPADDPNLHQAAERYGNVFPLQPDLLLLGIGDDGHTASLFPGSPALAETARRFVVAQVPVEPRLRITITPPAIAQARTILVLASGSNKADALRRVFANESNIHETPARLVRDALWLVDRDAATGIADVGISAK